MYKNAAVTEVAPTRLIIVLASLWIVIDTCRVSDESRCSDRTKSAWKLFVSQVFLCLIEVILVAMETSVDGRVQFALENAFTDLDISFSFGDCVIFFSSIYL